MKEFFARLKRAYLAGKMTTDSNSYSLNDKQITCPHCGNTEFEDGSALLNTTGMTLVNLDWADRSATILACKKCGYIQWFLNHPQKL